MVVRKKKRVSLQELIAYFALAWTLLTLLHGYSSCVLAVIHGQIKIREGWGIDD